MKVYRWYSSDAYASLVERLAAAKKGSGQLDISIFRALGGAWKQESTSKQGGEIVYEEVWRDGRLLYLWSQHYSKCMDHTILQIEQFNLSWSIKCNPMYCHNPVGRYTAGVWRPSYNLYEMHHDDKALAMAGALVKFIMGDGIEIDDDIPLSARP